MTRSSRFLVLSALLLVVVASSALAQPEEFLMGNKFYEQKDYTSAIRMYESVLDQGIESAPLYFNLGNAYFKSGDLGHAVVNYLRAQRMAPADEDILANLEFASHLTRVQMQGIELNPINAFLRSLVGQYHLNDLAWVASVLFVLTFVLLIIRYGLGSEHSVLRLARVGVITLLVAACLLTTYKYRDDYLTRRAVIIGQESPIFTGASVSSEIELQGAPGLVLEILEYSDEFLKVSLANKRQGWIQRELVAEL